MIVGERVRVTIEAMRNHYALVLKIDVFNVATEKVYMPDHLPDWINDVRQIQIACGDFVKHRCEKKKVLAIDDSHLEPRIPALFKLQRCIQSPKAAAENEDTGFVLHTNDWSKERANTYKPQFHRGRPSEMEIHRNFREPIGCSRDR